MNRFVYFRKTLINPKTLISLIVLFCLSVVCFPLQSEAYFNRGSISVQLGKTAISLTAGSSSTVSVTIDPIKQDQLPGCGMAECPQTCGDGCLDENGECMCGGTEYKTYYSEAVVSSSDSSVATASYSNGTLTVRGESPGSAEITVTGKLRQWTDTSVTLQVTVTEASYGPVSRNDSSADSTPSVSPAPAPQQQTWGDTSGDNRSGSSVIVEEAESAENGSTVVPGYSEVAPQEQTSETTVESPAAVQEDESSGGNLISSAEGEESADVYAPEGELRETPRGKYRFVVLNPLTDIPACFTDSAMEGSHLVFQQRSGDNVVYSWTFDGERLDPDFDYSKINLDIQGSAEIPEKLAGKLKGKNAYYMNFGYSGTLPDAAEINIKVTDSFFEDQALYLYQIDENSGELMETGQEADMANGYASFSIDHCSAYVLTDSEVETEVTATGEDASLSGGHGYGKLLLIVLLLILIGSGLFAGRYYLRQKR